MNSTRPPSQADYPTGPPLIKNEVLDKVGLTEAYREELDSLTRYLQGTSQHTDTGGRLLLNTIDPMERERMEYEVEMLHKLGVSAIEEIREQIGEYLEGMSKEEQELAFRLLLNTR